jgi:hypothetical protein
MGKRYIFSTSNTVFAGMPPESYRIMLDEYQGLVRQWVHHRDTEAQRESNQ